MTLAGAGLDQRSRCAHRQYSGQPTNEVNRLLEQFRDSAVEDECVRRRMGFPPGMMGCVSRWFSVAGALRKRRNDELAVYHAWRRTFRQFEFASVAPVARMRRRSALSSPSRRARAMAGSSRTSASTFRVRATRPFS
jgi:hypothetical protein